MDKALLVSILVIFYGFWGYPLLLWVWVSLKKRFGGKKPPLTESYLPTLTLIVPAYNEAHLLEQKIANCLQLDYPPEKRVLLFITDGSTDNSREILQRYPGIIALHQPARLGKTAAENRAMLFVNTELVVFSDANSELNVLSLKKMVRHFADPRIGCVAGEKRILDSLKGNASASGEQLYWRYESWIKQLDAEFNSCVGAAGELAAFRVSLYQPLPEDTLLDDFMQSIQIAARGYRIAYEENACATEPASPSVEEELKRKIRIAAGAWQAMLRMRSILHPFRTPVLFFQWVSRRFLRWVVIPVLLIFVLILSIQEAIHGHGWICWLMYAQVFFYSAAFGGYLLRNRLTSRKWLFVPYYFCIMHYAMIAGGIRYLRGKQSVIWEKAERGNRQNG